MPNKFEQDGSGGEVKIDFILFEPLYNAYCDLGHRKSDYDSFCEDKTGETVEMCGYYQELSSHDHIFRTAVKFSFRV